MSLADWFRPSRRIKRFLNKWVEKFTGRFYEGPEPPRRMLEEVRLFRLFYPDAGADEWEIFAATLAANSYKSGFVRGYEWQERGWEGPAVEPEQVAELLEQDWSLAEENPAWDKLLTTGYNLNDPLSGVSVEQRRAIIEMMRGAQLGGYTVEVDLSAYEDDDEEPGTSEYTAEAEEHSGDPPAVAVRPAAAEFQDDERGGPGQGGPGKQRPGRSKGLLRRRLGDSRPGGPREEVAERSGEHSGQAGPGSERADSKEES